MQTLTDIPRYSTSRQVGMYSDAYGGWVKYEGDLEWLFNNLQKGYRRYEYLRTISPEQFKKIWLMSLQAHESFDNIVDKFMVLDNPRSK